MSHFQDQLTPWFGPNHTPPPLLLGAMVTLSDFSKHARHVGLLISTCTPTGQPALASTSPKRLAEYYDGGSDGNLSLHGIWTKGRKKHMLTIYSNHSFSSD
ncbi:hypothetical protein VKT23_020336 [Stygiomarasmius scandens]|uniref:Flavin reductase like domain-containing protein n=1 Tax=Marasmiellus scandens TaxID=2682957 RepID=A0ABR1IJA7_9AGAR